MFNYISNFLNRITYVNIDLYIMIYLHKKKRKYDMLFLYNKIDV